MSQQRPPLPWRDSKSMVHQVFAFGLHRACRQSMLLSSFRKNHTGSSLSHRHRFLFLKLFSFINSPFGLVSFPLPSLPPHQPSPRSRSTVDDKTVRDFVLSDGPVDYFWDLVTFIRQQSFSLDSLVAEAEKCVVPSLQYGLSTGSTTVRHLCE